MWGHFQRRRQVRRLGESGVETELLFWVVERGGPFEEEDREGCLEEERKKVVMAGWRKGAMPLMFQEKMRSW